MKIADLMCTKSEACLKPLKLTMFERIPYFNSSWGWHGEDLLDNESITRSCNVCRKRPTVARVLLYAFPCQSKFYGFMQWGNDCRPFSTMHIEALLLYSVLKRQPFSRPTCSFSEYSDDRKSHSWKDSEVLSFIFQREAHRPHWTEDHEGVNCSYWGCLYCPPCRMFPSHPFLNCQRIRFLALSKSGRRLALCEGSRNLL